MTPANVLCTAILPLCATLVLAAPVAAYAAAPTVPPKCRAQPGYITLGPMSKEDIAKGAVRVDELQSPVEFEGKSVKLCPGTPYIIAPRAARDCLADVPRHGTVETIAASIRRQIGKRGCPMPRVLAVAPLVASPALPVAMVIPSGRIDLRQRRMINVLVPPPPALPNTTLNCDPGPLPTSLKTIEDLEAAYKGQVSDPRCPKPRLILDTEFIDRTLDGPDKWLVRILWPGRRDLSGNQDAGPLWILDKSVGKSQSTTPDFISRTIAQARDTARSEGLSPPVVLIEGHVADDDEGGDRIVARQLPAAGEALLIGTRLILETQKLPAAPEDEPLSPAAIGIGSAAGGFALGEMLRRVIARRKDQDPDSGGGGGGTGGGQPGPDDPDLTLLRARPDVPLLPDPPGSSAS